VRPKVTVLGAGELADSSASELNDRGYADVARDLADISGSAVVVLVEGGEDVLTALRDRAPNAVAVVAGDGIRTACETTLFPRSRIIGVEPEPEAVVGVVDAILLDRREEFTAIVRCQGERGIEDDFVAVPVRIGAGGVIEIVEP
jgi:hypothetical protein